MKIVPTDNRWNDFCLNSDAWFWQTTDWINYNMAYKPELNSKNLSFMVEENGQILAICPLLLKVDTHNSYDSQFEVYYSVYHSSTPGTRHDNHKVKVIRKYGEGWLVNCQCDKSRIVEFCVQYGELTPTPILGIKEFSFGGGFTWSPAFSNDLNEKKREKVCDFIFKEIDRLAFENNVVRSSFTIYPLSFPKYNYLMKYGYINTSINTQIIDLRQDLKTIHSAMSKGHDYDIDRGLKIFDAKIYDNKAIGYAFLKYHELHTKDAGRETRPQLTWDMQQEWMDNGRAILIGVVLNYEWIGFSYIITYKKKAYYFSACSDSYHSDLPIGHVLTWKAIEYLKERGFEFFEIGWQQYTPQPYDLCSDKEVAISHFKKGFGGNTVPLFRGEKYYSKEYFEKVWADRISQYWGCSSAGRTAVLRC